MPKSYKNCDAENESFGRVSVNWNKLFSIFSSVFSCIHIITFMIVAIARSSKLIFINNKKDFTEKEPAYVTLVDAKFFKTI